MYIIRTKRPDRDEMGTILELEAWREDIRGYSLCIRDGNLVQRVRQDPLGPRGRS